MKTKPDLSFWKLWNLSFGFFGVQIAYALQSANVSRIFATIGADPHDLSYFWILPPLMGLIVQPIVGTMSDRTWNRFGRRIPYLIAGALVAVAVMCLLPNAGSLGLTISSAIIVGLAALMLLDTSINMAMQPFKMLVGDMVNERQKGLAYSIQSFLCNAGSIVGFVFPFLFAWIGLQKTAPEGEVPQTVVWSFYIGAAILMLCVIYSIVKIREWPPKLYEEYNGSSTTADGEKNKTSLVNLLRNAPSTFWTVGVVQFFCWFAFLFMWTYTTGTVAMTAFDTPVVDKITAISDGETSVSGKFILINDTITIVAGGRAQSSPTIDSTTDPSASADKRLLQYLHSLSGHITLTTGTNVAKDHQTGRIDILEKETHSINADRVEFITKKDLDTTSEQYSSAGDWVGILFAIQALGSVLWAIVLPRFRSRKFSYALSLLLGAVGFVMAGIITDRYLLFIPFILIGCAWAAMLAWPFTILTNSLRGGNIGAYLGLFNCSICIPQIIAALAGGWILAALSVPDEVAPQYMMMIVAGISLAAGACCVHFIKEGGGKNQVQETPAESEII